MRIDVDALLAPISEEAPAGVDLADDDGRLAIDDIFESVQRADFEGDEPDWRSVTGEVVELLRRSKDLWLAVYLCRAGASLGDLEQVADGARLLASLAKDWNGVYPTIDDVGAHGRKSRCAELSRRRAFLLALESTPLVGDPRLGTFSTVDIEGFANAEQADPGFIRLLEGSGKSQLTANLASIVDIIEAINGVEAAFRANAESTADWPDFEPLHHLLGRMRRAAIAWLGEGAQETASETTSANGAALGPFAAGGAGPIRSRDDVVRAIDAICAYYARQEPASAVPLALIRARGWVYLDFLAVLEDIAPGSASEARRVLSVSKSDDNF